MLQYKHILCLVLLLTVTIALSFICITCSGSDVSVLGDCDCINGATLVILSSEVMDGRRSRPYCRETTGLLFDRNCICKIRNRN